MLNSQWNEVNERCGVILKDGTEVEAKNTHKFPHSNFTMDQEFLDQLDLDNVACFWHTHPSNDLNLSVTDYENFLKYPDHIHRIYSAFDYADYYVRRGFIMRVEK